MKHEGIKRFFLMVLYTALAMALLCVGVWQYQVRVVNANFITTFYQVPANEYVKEMRLVLLSDLHLHEYGEDNADLVNKITLLEPDIIVMAGDMNMDDQPGYDSLLSLICQLTPVAPVYFSPGNHEYAHVFEREGSTIVSDIRAAGAIYLDNAFESVTVGANTFSIGGLGKYPTLLRQYPSGYQMLEKFCAQDTYTILINHYPEIFLEGGGMEDYPVDLALCGHAHGGLIRIPLLNCALYTPDQGLLPDLTEGCTQLQNGTYVVVSRGLGDSHMKLPRIFNQPELVVVDIR